MVCVDLLFSLLVFVTDSISDRPLFRHLHCNVMQCQSRTGLVGSCQKLDLKDSNRGFSVIYVKNSLLYERIKERELPDKVHPEVLIDKIIRFL